MSLDNYKSQFNSLLSNLTDEPKSVLDARKSAFDDFIKLGLPSKKHELWQFTDLSNIEKTKFDIINKNGSSIKTNHLEKLSIPNSTKIVIENGVLNNELSDHIDKIIIKNTIDDFIGNSKSLPDNRNLFVSLNNAFANGGYSVEVPNNFNDEKPLHIINVITDDRNSIQNHLLNTIKVGKNSTISIIEEFVGNNRNLFFNTVNNIEIAENSNLNYSVFQNNNSDLINLNNIFVQQKNDSNYSGQFITKNGSLIRNDINIQIDGENCESNISGLGLLDNTDHIENYTVISHNKPNCNSNQLFKYILKDSSEGVFNGLVRVQPDAQQTDSQQTNRNILLSKKALMNSNPQLEIYADDVKCAHGSATGELDEDAIFYLRSRGIDLITAKSLLIEGFAKEVVEQIGNEYFKNKIKEILLEWLSN